MANTPQIKAWAGGDLPPEQWPFMVHEHQLVDALYASQVAECGGLDLWACAGTSAVTRADIFKNRARLDAWATLREQYGNPRN